MYALFYQLTVIQICKYMFMNSCPKHTHVLIEMLNLDVMHTVFSGLISSIFMYTFLPWQVFFINLISLQDIWEKEMHAPTHLVCLGFRVAKLGNILIQLIKHSFD